MRNRQMPVEGKIPPLAVVSPSGLSAIRHRLLLSLALAPGLTVRELAAVLGVDQKDAFDHVTDLDLEGLTEKVSRGQVGSRYWRRPGYRLRPGVVVSEKGFVGRVVPLESGR